MISVLIFLIYFSFNPVKIGGLVLIYSLFLVMHIYKSSGFSWFPIILLLLFSGGILVVFIMLSSIHPNQEVQKSKLSFLPMGTVFILTLIPKTSLDISFKWRRHERLKMFFQEFTRSLILTSVILFYFLIFTKILEKEVRCIRLTLCYGKSNFVI